MLDTLPPEVPDFGPWQKRRELTAFHQERIGAVERSATFAMTSGAAVMLGVASPLMHLQGLPPGSDGTIILAVVAIYFLLVAIIITGYARQAEGCRQQYLAEHAAYFPGDEPYRLVGLLLQFADRNPRLIG